MRLSVIIPSYNTAPEVLERSVSSVVRATTIDDEIIVIDDCSSKYVEAFDMISRRYPKVVIVHEVSNRGQAHARNVGLEMAKGEYVAFIDSDDEVFECAYSKSIAVLKKTDADIVVYGVKTKWDELHLSKIDCLAEKNYGVLDTNGFGEIWGRCLFTYPWNKVYKKEFLNRHGLRFKEHCIPREDEVFNFECICANAKWVSLEYVGHIYYHQSNSSLGRYRPYNHESNVAVEHARAQCLKFLGCDDCSKLGIKVMSDIDLVMSDWRNIWRRYSPYSYYDRYKWLCININHVSTVKRCQIFFKMFVWSVFRNYFYFNFLRRINIKRLHKNIVSE